MQHQIRYNQSVMDTRPVGFFDSGLGGLTAVSAFHREMPEENIIYFGDTARNPYGTRSVQELRKMADDNLRFLQSFDVKAIIAACGTMSANVPDVLAASPVPVIDVLRPAVRAMARIPGERPLAVIATEASIRSGAFTRALQDACPGRSIVAVPCQEFVALCETGHTSPRDELLCSATARLLAPLKEQRPAALLLGCTHFGLIAEAIRDFLGPETALVSASGCAAKEMRRFLEAHDMAGGSGSMAFYTSGDEAEFEERAGSFLGRPITARKGTAGE